MSLESEIYRSSEMGGILRENSGIVTPKVFNAFNFWSLRKQSHVAFE